MRNIIIIPLLIYIFIFFDTRWCSCTGNSPDNSTLKCIPSERAVLLKFKQNITYFKKDVLSSWAGDECCNWNGVTCDDTTGHIHELYLAPSDVDNNLLKMEKLEPLVYLLELTQLESLDLSYNNFTHSSIPRFIGSMKQLRYLTISMASLGGLIPYELGNLTNLQELDLTCNKLSGEIPASLGNLLNLNELNLYQNNLSSIASSLRFPLNLEDLSLADNKLSGKIPTSLGQLSKLDSLNIEINPFEDTVLSELHFANLSSLTRLYMDGTMVTLNLSTNWVPPFQLQLFSASNINGELPLWLQTQKSLTDLYLVDAKYIRDHAELVSYNATTLQCGSYNKLVGSPIFPINFGTINLSYNSLSGEILPNGGKKEVYEEASFIDLSDNLFSVPLSEGLGHMMPELSSLVLSNNQISGRIPDSFCQLTWLISLDIKNNSLSGEIPNCWDNVTSLTFVRLSYNKLRGRIPCFYNSASFLYGDKEFYLHLNDNMFSEEIPSCLSNLTHLKVLDIGRNQLSGKMPKWFSAEKFRELKILRLRDNKFSGTIPRQICSLPHLQIMDLGHNQFTGYIPPCLSNLSAMTLPNASRYYDKSDVSEVIQGIELAYTSTLLYLVDIDLSCNNLVGSIPDDMTKIVGLLSLNLSYNQLSGTIPENIGGLKKLISLDLSKNKLRGSIPTSIGQIYTLSHLNLSYNNLSGAIPTGNQLQTHSDQASIYAGNPYLCGDFLPKKCKTKVDEQDKGMSNKGKGDNKEKLEKMGFDLVLMSGFATGFWGVVGSLALSRRWRHAVFRCLEDGYNWLYVILVLKVRVVKAKINWR